MTEEVKLYFVNKEMESIYNLKPQTSKSVGVDLMTPEDIHLNLLDSVFINFGIVIGIPEGYFAAIVPRSSLFKKYGVIQTNHFGVIDGDYSGKTDTLGMWMQCTSSRSEARDDSNYDTFIPKYTRIAQLFILPRISFTLVPYKEHWGDESRGGFGSTGV